MIKTVREMLAILQKDGWTVDRQAGSHRTLVHPTKTGIVTVAGAPHKEIPPGTFNSIMKQAGLK